MQRKSNPRPQMKIRTEMRITTEPSWDMEAPSTSRGAGSGTTRHNKRHNNNLLCSPSTSSSSSTSNKRLKTSSSSSSPGPKIWTTSRTTSTTSISPRRARGGAKSIRQTLREAVLDENQDDLRRSVRELEDLRQKAEEKAESRKIKLAELNFRIRERDAETQRMRNRFKSIEVKIRECKKEVIQKSREIATLKMEVVSANKKVEKAEKAELERAKVESRKAMKKNGAHELFFQDVMRNFQEMIESNLQCSICNEVYIFASTVDCGHSFCEECISEWRDKKEEANCPICRADISKQVSNLALDSYVEKASGSFFPEEAKSQREVLVTQRRTEREVRKTLMDANKRRNMEHPQQAAFSRLNLLFNMGTPRLELDSDTSEDEEWEPMGNNSSVAGSSPAQSDSDDDNSNATTVNVELSNNESESERDDSESEEHERSVQILQHVARLPQGQVLNEDSDYYDVDDEQEEENEEAVEESSQEFSASDISDGEEDVNHDDEYSDAFSSEEE